jgi:hypothetical protein
VVYSCVLYRLVYVSCIIELVLTGMTCFCYVWIDLS